ncbi:MAG: CsgG/HfaB family protein [Elusimicrobiota bacterium]
MTKFGFVFISIYLCFSGLCFTQEEGTTEEKPRLAILDLGAQDVSAVYALKGSELLRTAIFNTGLFTVIERNEMQKIFEEQKLPLTGCVDEKCGIQIGRMLSANKILVGTIIKLGEKIIINARIVDVEKGKLDFAEKTSGTKVDELDIACDEFANKLAARITKKPYQHQAVTIPTAPPVSPIPPLSPPTSIPAVQPEVSQYSTEAKKIIDTLKKEIKLKTIDNNYSIFSLCYSPDGKYIVSTGDCYDERLGGSTIKIWSGIDGSLLRALEGHSGDVQSLCWSPDGKYLASGSSDFTIKIWQIGR